MKKKLLVVLLMLSISPAVALAQKPAGPAGQPMMNEMPIVMEQDELTISINPMSMSRKNKVNQVAAAFRNNNRSVLTDLGRSVLSGGATALVTVVAEELINLTKVRSEQKKKWEAMRNRECLFVDSLESVRGQRDFYNQPSKYGPLDPTDMNFDGVTFSATRNRQEVLRMVCRIDTTRLSEMFLHSKFFLVLDTLVFYPYRSYLPNLPANRIGMAPGKKGGKKSKKQLEQEAYLQTISRFSYEENGVPQLSISMDLSSSWINEQVQVYKDVKLGSFSLNVPIPKEQLQADSVYVYSRERALAQGQTPIQVDGECFVVPRSYMPVSAHDPSWGTGEFKMKITLAQRARYNPDGERAKNWHDDYKQLVRMQNNGKAENDYWKSVKTTFMEKSGVVMKAAYTPLVNYGTTTVTGWINPTAAGAAAKGAGKAAAAAAAAAGKGAAAGQGAGAPGHP